MQIDQSPDETVLNESEQEALQVGEELVNEQQALLAGKFEDAEALEKAYIELQKKLGEPKDESTNDIGDEESDKTEEQPEEVNPAVELITNASSQFAETGELTPEMKEQFNQMSSQELVDAYISMQGNLPTQQQTPDLSDADINVIKNSVGGEEGYTQLMDWAGENLNEQYIEAFNDLTMTGNAAAIQLAVAGLQAQYEQNYGSEGRMLSGRDARSSSADVFRSQAEVVAAMQDPRYDKDPAFRQDVFEKLDRSNIDF